MGDKACYRSINRYKYQLMEDFDCDTNITGFNINLPYIKLDVNGTINIMKGYAWDGASGPTIDTLNSMRASLVHDAFYQLIRMKELGHDQIIPSDKLFRQMLREDGMSAFRAWYWYRGLRLANGAAAKKEQKPVKVICAP